jgi:hypothetical protein
MYILATRLSIFGTLEILSLRPQVLGAGVGCDASSGVGIYSSRLQKKIWPAGFR